MQEKESYHECKVLIDNSVNRVTVKHYLAEPPDATKTVTHGTDSNVHV